MTPSTALPRGRGFSPPRTWDDAAAAVELLIADQRESFRRERRDEDGYADSAKLLPAPANPEALAAEVTSAIAQLKRAPDASLLERTAAKVRWLRKSISGRQWGAMMGALRQMAMNVGPEGPTVREYLDAAFVPKTTWRVVVEGASSVVPRTTKPTVDVDAVRAALPPVDAPNVDEQLVAWLPTAALALDTALLVEMLRPHRATLARVSADVSFPDRRARRRFRDVLVALKLVEESDDDVSAEGAGAEETDERDDVNERDEHDVAGAEFEALVDSVRNKTAGRTAMFVSNREDPESREQDRGAVGLEAHVGGVDATEDRSGVREDNARRTRLRPLRDGVSVAQRRRLAGEGGAPRRYPVHPREPRPSGGVRPRDRARARHRTRFPRGCPRGLTFVLLIDRCCHRRRRVALAVGGRAGGATGAGASPRLSRSRRWSGVTRVVAEASEVTRDFAPAETWLRTRLNCCLAVFVHAPSSRSAQITVDIGIVTIREDEFAAILEVFPKDLGHHVGKREYALREAEGPDGRRYRLGIVRQIEQGTGHAQSTAHDLIADLGPRLVLVVGIAGAPPTTDFTLGDVIVSTRIADFTVDAAQPGGVREFSATGGPIQKGLASKVANLGARTKELGSWAQELPKRAVLRWVDGDLRGDEAWQERLVSSLKRHFGRKAQPRQPKVFTGVVASSDSLIKDPMILVTWLKTARHICAIEMESAGVYHAQTDSCPMLAIRGLSDIVGLKRSDDWTAYACKSAAAFTRAFLKTGPIDVPQENPTPPDENLSGSRPRQRAAAALRTQILADTVYANLIPLVRVPERIYVAPSQVKDERQGWAKLVDGSNPHIHRAWLLSNNMVLSLLPFDEGPGQALSSIVDVGAMEAHDATDWYLSDDRARARHFVYLLNGALREHLYAAADNAVRFDHRDRVYYFSAPGTLKYKLPNLQKRSTITVVGQYSGTSETSGDKYSYTRHNAFAGQFRFLDRSWFLEITPTYRFLTDAKTLSPLHEVLLSGIKRRESNRAVLSQILLWANVLREAKSKPALLEFGTLLSFPTTSIADELFTPDQPPAPAAPHEPTEAEVAELLELKP